MPLRKPRVLSLLRSCGLFLLGAALFALAYAQAPLYFSNQNQYFLHGLANAGYGNLDQDWLANCADSAPLFSGLVAVSYQCLGETPFYVYYALLMGVYLVSLVGLFDVLAGDRATPTARLLFVALLLFLHSALLRALSARLLGVDYPWYFQAGVAGQYVLGPMLQPSTFGVLLLSSLLLFARGKPLLAVTCSSLGAVCHATYLLPAALLTMAYMTVLYLRLNGDSQHRHVLRALAVGAWALILVLPTVVIYWLTFRSTPPKPFGAAQSTLVHFRLPHHCLPQLWFDGIAAVQVAWMLLGIVLTRGSRLFPALLLAFLLATTLTLVQVVTEDDTLALLFPWRVSVILMPAATAIILTRLVLLFPPSSTATSKTICAASAAVVLLVVAGGMAISVYGLAFQERDEELPLLAFVREHQMRGDLYLIPGPLPNLKAVVRGAAKSDFKPLATLEKNSQFIPLDFQRFRLLTGAPLYVDFKSIPYKDTDVLEWYERLEFNQQAYRDLKAGKFDKVLPELRGRGITHVVMRASEALHSPQLAVVYADDRYTLYRVAPA